MIDAAEGLVAREHDAALAGRPDTPGHGAARWYRDEGFGPPAKMHVLWKGVDLAAFDAAQTRAAALRRELGLGAGDLAIGTVGRLAWQKGIDDLLAAVRLVRPVVPGAR